MVGQLTSAGLAGGWAQDQFSALLGSVEVVPGACWDLRAQVGNPEMDHKLPSYRFCWGETLGLSEAPEDGTVPES